MNMRPLNILLLPRWYPNRQDPQLGVFIQKHARAIALHHQLIVFYAIPDDHVEGQSIEMEKTLTDGIHEYRYYFRADHSVFRPLINTLRYLSCWRNFRKQTGLYRKGGFRPDVLHAYIVLRTALLARCLKSVHGTPFVLSEQWSGYVTGRFQKLNVIKRLLIRTCIQRADGLSAVSDFLKKSMQQLSGRTDIRVIHNIIEAHTIQPRSPSDGKIKIAMVADLVDEIKNISGVIRTMSRLKSFHPEAELHLIGGGPDEVRLKSLARNEGILDTSVYFYGRQDNQRVYDLLDRCDFLVMNSRFETFSLICAEALSCGKPVIATRCGGPEEIIHEKNGILIPIDNDDALLSAMRTMIRSINQFSPESLRAEATLKYSSDTAAKGFDALYRLVIRPS